MVINIKWCLNQRGGLELVEPNTNMSDSYIKMADESLGLLKDVENKSRVWTASICYYTMYYSLYSLMMRIGVKSEIHSCSILFMKEFLGGYYDRTDMKMIEEAFTARNNLQYYTDRPVNEKTLGAVKNHCRLFLIKTKEAIMAINQTEIKEIRKKIEIKIKS